MTVVTSTILLVRRIKDLQRRRDILLERQDQMRRRLPEWTFAPLQLVGMSADEIRGAVGEIDRAHSDMGLEQVERQLDEIDRQVEDLENTLLSLNHSTIDGVQALLDLAIARFSQQTPTDPQDVFYDYGDARVLRLLEHAAEELRGVTADEQRHAG